MTPAIHEPRIQTPDIRVMLSHFIRQVEAGHIRTRTQRPTARHYDYKSKQLVEYSWPGQFNPDWETPFDPTLKRIPPGDLEHHRRIYDFRNPCCFCAFLDGEQYTETHICIVEVLNKDEDRNRHCVLNGEFVAQCAKQRCGYFLCLERFYTQPDIAVKLYELRAIPLPVQNLIHIPDIEKSFRRGDGLFQVMPDIVSRGHRGDLKVVDPRETKGVDPGVWSSLMKGVSEDSFWDTFVQCMQCKQVTVREHFATNHRCPKSKGPRDERYHPYRRVISRMDTIPGDEPEQPFPSTGDQTRPSTPASTYAYDPEDVAVSDHGASELGDEDYVAASGFGGESEAEDDVGQPSHSGLNSDSESAWPWWLPDAPPLPDFEELPSLTQLFRGPQVERPISNLRTQIVLQGAEVSGGF